MGAPHSGNSLRSLGLPLAAALTLGLAPFFPEPHLIGKLRWVLGGGVGMGAVDVFDLVMHGAPWVWLVAAVVRWALERRGSRRSASTND